MFFITLCYIIPPIRQRKKHDTEAEIASLKAEIEKLRNENHNLKRQVKRSKERKAAEIAEQKEAQAERDRRTEEVTKESLDDIKKKLIAAGMDSKAAEVMAWVMFGDTGSKKK